MELLWIVAIVWWLVKKFAKANQVSKEKPTIQHPGQPEQATGQRPSAGDFLKRLEAGIEQMQRMGEPHAQTAPKVFYPVHKAPEQTNMERAPLTAAFHVEAEADRAAKRESLEGWDDCHEYMYQDPRSHGESEEGVDLCHEDMLASEVQPSQYQQDFLPEVQGGLRLDAAKLMQGVVLSEILTRPQTRWRRNR